MGTISKSKLTELQNILSKLSLDVCCVTALPELGVRWRQVAKAVRYARLPMTPSSVARVLRCHVANTLSQDEVDDIIPRLRLVVVATQTRTWHVINLLDEKNEVPVSTSTQLLPSRIYHALRESKVARNRRPEVQTIKLGDFVYISVQLSSLSKESSPLYLAVSPGTPVALVSTVGMSKLLKVCVEGLGFAKYEDAKLYGRDIHSLLRINDRANNGHPDHLIDIPEYNPMPVVTKTGIDYTNKAYNMNYVNSILGPNPPLLTELNIKLAKKFYDRTRLNKVVNVSIKLKSDDIAKTLKEWVSKGALSPTSEFFSIFHEIKSNKLTIEQDSE